MSAVSKKRTLALGAGLAFALVGGVAVSPAQAAPPAMFCQNPADPSQDLEIAPIESLTPGDALSWKSTVSGTAPQTFDASYVAKIDGGLGHDAYGNPIDILLVDLDNTDPKLKDLGAWAGASGSPVYDDQGRLVGAVAYGFSEQGESVAGITPAAAMKTIGTLPGGVTVSAQARAKVAEVTGVRPGRTMQRIKNVQLSNGFDADRLANTEKQLQRAIPGYRLPRALDASGSQKIVGFPINGAADAGADLPIVAGGNIAVSYAYGDLLQASVGTVTAVCGDEVWAYGHPDGFDRNQKANVHGASAARIVRDGGNSYKEISSLGKVKGRVTADELVGVKAKLGANAATVPVTTVSRIGTHTSTATTHVSAKALISAAAAAQLGDDATRMLKSAVAGSAKLDWQISFTRKGGKTGVLKNSNRYSSNGSSFLDGSLPEQLGNDVAGDIEALQQNELERVTITGVKVAASYSPEYLIQRVSGVQIRKHGAWKNLRNGATAKVVRGKTYRLRTVLKSTTASDRDLTSYVPFNVRVPKNLKRTMTFTVSAESPMDEMEVLAQILGGGTDVDASIFAPQSFDQLLMMLDDNVRNDQFELSSSYRTKSGLRQNRFRELTAAQVVQGGSQSFALQAPKLKKKAVKKA